MGKNAHEANRQVGERMVGDEVRWLGEKAKELVADYDRLRPQHVLRTFGDVERLWETVVRPRLPEFFSMQAVWDGQHALPEGSIWLANKTIPEWG
jgi:creatinine amidohydrolase